MADRVGEGGAAEVQRLRVEDDVVDGARPTALVDVAARARKAAGSEIGELIFFQLVILIEHFHYL